MRSKFTISSKILLLLVSIATLSAGISALVGFNIAQTALKEQAFQNLTALRELKTKQVEGYFQQIENQVITFSEDRMLIEAMKTFKTAFNTLDKEFDIEQEKRDAFDLDLRLYYQNEFLPRLNKNLESDISLADYWPAPQNTRILQHQYISSNPFETGNKHLIDTAKDETTYSRAHALYHPVILHYLEKFGYYDIFLIDNKTGHIVYSVFKEVDFATSLLTGPYRDTNFAEVFRAAKNAGANSFFQLIDFKPYHPSYNGQASFIASPIFDDTEQVGVLVFQMPIDRINAIMSNDQQWKTMGFGDSGETYIVGDDLTLRTEPRFLIEQPQNYLQQLRDLGVASSKLKRIENLGSAIGLQQVDTRGSREAMNGRKGIQIFPDYRGVPVLSSYSPLNIKGVNWVLLSEIDQAEAFAPTKKLRNQVLLWLLVLLAIALLIAWFFSRSLVRPLNRLAQNASDLAAGNLDKVVEIDRGDEIGNLAESFETMRCSIKALIDRQAEMIDALSTPLIPLQDGVVVLPLVGEFDERRIHQFQQTLREGIHRLGANTAIIDITGVPAYSELFAHGLEQSAAAARLLGAKLIVTGMQPELAEGLANSTRQLLNMVALRSLQDGIDYALSYTIGTDSNNSQLQEQGR